MIIEVFVANWQLDCCGDPFELGATVTWGIHAGEPADNADGVPRFVEDHHDLVDEPVQFWEVSGDVVEIYAVSHKLVRVPGTRFTTNDLSEVAEEQVTEAVRFRTVPDGFTHMGFRVRLAVDDDTRLPEYVEAAWVAERREREKTEEETLIASRASEVGRRLSELCDRTARRFGQRVEVIRSDRTTGVTIQPLAAGGCAVRWIHFGSGIEAWVGEGEWSLPGSPQGVSELERFVDAAAIGGVRERVWRDRLATVISESGIEFARMEVPFTPPQGGGNFVGTHEFERYFRGDVDYKPW